MKQVPVAIFSEENHAGIFHDVEEFSKAGTDAFALLVTSAPNSRVQCGHGAVRVRGTARRPHGFIMTRCTQADCVKDAGEWWRVNQHLVTGDTELTPDTLKCTMGDDSSVLQRSSSIRPKEVIRAAEESAKCMTAQEAGSR